MIKLIFQDRDISYFRMYDHLWNLKKIADSVRIPNLANRHISIMFP